MESLTIPKSLELIAAPMVNQSDLPFRLLARRHGATLAYTQMLSPHRLLEDQDYLEFHLRDIQADFGASARLARPIVVQLHGNDPETLVKAGRVVQMSCDAVGEHSQEQGLIEIMLNVRRTTDLNLGCPQEHARDGHYGGYLLGKKDWPLVEQIGASFLQCILLNHMADLQQFPACQAHFPCLFPPRSASASHPL